MGNMPVAYYRGENQSGFRHGIQQAGDGAGWRILRVGGGVRRAAVGSDGGLCDGGRGW